MKALMYVFELDRRWILGKDISNLFSSWNIEEISFISFSHTFMDIVKMRIGLLAETLGTWSLLGHGTWPQLMCCALVAVRVPEVGRGRVGALEQGGSSDSD